MCDQIRKILKKETWEIKTLEEVAEEVYSGNEVTKAQLGTGDYPAIRYCEIHSSNVCISDNTNFINPELIKNKKYCEYGDLLIVKTSEDVENVGKAAAYLGKKCILGSDIFLVKHSQNVKFLSYILSSKGVRRQIKSIATIGTVMHFNRKHFSKIKIPLPPRHIQDLIANYLDTWTKLERELERELESRKKQYQHYKELLLSSEIDKWDR